MGISLLDANIVEFHFAIKMAAAILMADDVSEAGTIGIDQYAHH
jgi:hypothetical protein